MSSHDSKKEIMGNTIACLVALVIMPASVCLWAQNNKTPQPAPARPAPVRRPCCRR